MWEGAAVTATAGVGLDRVKKGTDFTPSSPERGMAPYGAPSTCAGVKAPTVARVGVGEAAGDAGWVKAMLRSTGAAMVAAWAVDLAVSKLQGGNGSESGGLHGGRREGKLQKGLNARRMVRTESINTTTGLVQWPFDLRCRAGLTRR